MNTQNYNVNLRVGIGIAPKVRMSQGDVGRELAFNIYDGVARFSPPSGSVVKIKGTKPSGLGFNVACALSGNVASVLTTLDMTQEGGAFPVELEISNGNTVIGTANFAFYIEPSPHPDGTTDGTHATVDNLQTQIGNLANLTTTAKTNLVSAINEAAQSGGVVIDDTLTQTGQAADAKKTGDEISQIKADLDNLEPGLSDTAKVALLACFDHVAWDDDDPTGQTYITALQNALYPPADLVSISAVYTQGGTVYDTDSLNDLKSDLVVTALMSDQTTRPVTDYTLSGTLTEGTSTITVSYGGKTTTFTVTVSTYTTAPVIAVQNAYIYTDYTTPSYNGFGVTKKYEYSFSENTLINCQYYDSTNDYMNTAGWSGLTYYISDANTRSNGVSWPSGAKAKNSLFRDGAGAGYSSITTNTEKIWNFSRYSPNGMRSNGVAFTLPLLDLDDCYAYWCKPLANSILPDGVAEGDIIFAGANTQYYGKHNIND